MAELCSKQPYWSFAPSVDRSFKFSLVNCLVINVKNEHLAGTSTPPLEPTRLISFQLTALTEQ